MNPLDDYFYLGKIIKPNGYKGKVNAYLDTDEPGFYADVKMLYLSINGMPVPYFVEDIHIINNKAVITFQDINSIEKAEILSQIEIYLPMSDLPPLSGKQFYYHEVKGFKVTDKNHGILGEISQVLEYPNQAVFQIFKNEKEILIPINSEIILQVDRQKKEIHIEAPEGLIEIYTG
jgi:16S rRNA processing protein RimM